MASGEGRTVSDITVDTANLYREEVFSDLRAASIRRLTPVKVDGQVDESRDPMYIGDTTLMTQMGPLPVQFALEAKSLEDAFAKFPEGVKEAVAQLNERAREMVRDEASRIVVPNGMPPGMSAGAPGAAPGAMPGPGKIVLK